MIVTQPVDIDDPAARSSLPGLCGAAALHLLARLTVWLCFLAFALQLVATGLHTPDNGRLTSAQKIETARIYAGTAQLREADRARVMFRLGESKFAEKPVKQAGGLDLPQLAGIARRIRTFFQDELYGLRSAAIALRRCSSCQARAPPFLA